MTHQRRHRAHFLNSDGKPVGNHLHICKIIPIALLLFAIILPNSSAMGISVDYDKSSIIVKLAANTGNELNLSAGAKRTGRSDFDRACGEYGIVQLHQPFKPLRSTHPNAALARQRGLADYVVVQVPEGIAPDALRERLINSPDVLLVEYDIIAHIAEGQFTPNDPYFSTHQYPLRNTGSQPPADPGTAGADAEMQTAWDYSEGDSSIVIAIIDTGLDLDHPDLFGKLWFNPNETEDGIDSDENGYTDDVFGWNFVSNNPFPDDDHSHGSHCAGIAGAQGNNGIGIAGMALNCKLMALKSLNESGSGSSAQVAEAIYYAANNGAKVISMSLGSYGSSTVESDAVIYAKAAGTTIFFFFCNDNTSSMHFPAAYDEVIAVGATDSDDNRAHPLCSSPGSNYGDWINICAAGDWVWSTEPPGTYGYKCGTSMATPHAAGLGALVLSIRPDFTPDQVQHYIQSGAEDLVGRVSEDTPGFDIYHGWGRINGRITLQALVDSLPPILTVPGAQVVDQLDTLTFTVSAFDSNFSYPIMTAESLPLNASLVDSGDGVGWFTFVPDLTQEGDFAITFIADDGELADTGEVMVTVNGICSCPLHGNTNGDEAINVLDVIELIDYVFRSGPQPPIDPGCFHVDRGDINCDGVTTVLDVVASIDHVFRSGPPPCNPCECNPYPSNCP